MFTAFCLFIINLYLELSMCIKDGTGIMGRGICFLQLYYDFL